MESRENNVELKAMGLVQEFIKKFRSIDFTIHPSNIPGESPGKGSNMAWAVRKLSEKYSMEARKDVIVTGIDGTFSTFCYSSCTCGCIHLRGVLTQTLCLQLTATSRPTTLLI